MCARTHQFSLARLTNLVLLAGFCTLWVPASFAQSSPNAEESRILTIEKAWNVAEVNRDAKALDLLLDGSFVYVDEDGVRMTKPQFMAWVRSTPIERVEIVNESQEAHVFGDSAVVTATYRVSGKNQGKPFARRGRFTDTWISRNGTWVCVASQSTWIAAQR